MDFVIEQEPFVTKVVVQPTISLESHFLPAHRLVPATTDLFHHHHQVFPARCADYYYYDAVEQELDRQWQHYYEQALAAAALEQERQRRLRQIELERQREQERRWRQMQLERQREQERRRRQIQLERQRQEEEANLMFSLLQEATEWVTKMDEDENYVDQDMEQDSESMQDSEDMEMEEEQSESEAELSESDEATDEDDDEEEEQEQEREQGPCIHNVQNASDDNKIPIRRLDTNLPMQTVTVDNTAPEPSEQEKVDVAMDTPSSQEKYDQLHLIEQRLTEIAEKHQRLLPDNHLVFDPDNQQVVATTPDNRQFLGLEDEVMQVMLQLDAIDSDGDEQVRKRRKALIVRAEELLGTLDDHKQREWERSSVDSSSSSS